MYSILYIYLFDLSLLVFTLLMRFQFIISFESFVTGNADKSSNIGMPANIVSFHTIHTAQNNFFRTKIASISRPFDMSKM